MNWDTDMALWIVRHADGRNAVVRASSGPNAMQALGWRAASFEVVTQSGPTQVLLTAPASVPEYVPEQHIEVLNEGVEGEGV